MEKVTTKLDDINKTLEKILGVMVKPENPFMKVLSVAGIGVGILGIVQVIDTMKKWFGEGYGFTAYSRHSFNSLGNLYLFYCAKIEAAPMTLGA